MSEEKENKEPKIIVDEDWKSQVEREKEELREKEAEKEAAENSTVESTPESEAVDQSPTDSDQPNDEPVGEMPPASFLGLLSMLGSQAMAALGVLPDFATGETHVNRPFAKHCIDMIGIIQEKTKNNLTDDEAAHIRDALHQLRMMYVSTAPAGDSAGDE
ncbi:MAG: DUF1844 domain-containing protein [Planctomycetota bacterium]